MSELWLLQSTQTQTYRSFQEIRDVSVPCE